MSETLEWNKARKFLRGTYRGGIKKMFYPIGPNGTWVAEVVRDNSTIKVEFQHRKRRWTILNEKHA